MMDLSPLTIVVTRPGAKGKELCGEIESSGGKAIHFPTMVIAPPPNEAAFLEAVGALGEQDWLIFISPQAVLASSSALQKAWPKLPPKVKCAAIGAGTAEVLQVAGYSVDLCPSKEFSSEALLALPPLQALSGKKIAIIRGVGGRQVLEETLQERGADVLPVVAYQRLLPTPTADCVAALFKQPIHAMVCTSFEGVRNLQSLVGDENFHRLTKGVLIVISERIKTLAEDLGFQTIWVARNASHSAILSVLAQLACVKKGTQHDR